jgi:hypothetical protein
MNTFFSYHLSVQLYHTFPTKMDISLEFRFWFHKISSYVINLIVANMHTRCKT